LHPPVSHHEWQVYRTKKGTQSANVSFWIYSRLPVGRMGARSSA
jgi:hypothetical protein